MSETVTIKQLENITECSTCVGDLSDSRLLPCSHTFCMKCLDSWTQGQPVAQVSCPICCEKFDLSEKGMSALPKDFFIDKMLEAKTLSSRLAGGEARCDICGSEESIPRQTDEHNATFYCVECRQNLCDHCSKYHKKFSVSSSHRSVELASQPSAKELLMKFPVLLCDAHEDKSLEIFCFDCQVALCVICYVNSHSSHRCSDIKDIGSQLRQQVAMNAEHLGGKACDYQTILDRVDENENAFCDSVSEVMSEICTRADRLTKLVEDYKNSMVEELLASKDSQLKRTTRVREEMKRNKISIENFVKYLRELSEKGSDYDIAKLAGELNRRAEALLSFDIESDLSEDYKVVEVKFDALKTDDEALSVLGKLTFDVHGYFKLSGKSIQSASNSTEPVTGIAVLRGLFYVSRWRQSNIEVYCSTTLRFQHDMSFHCASCGRQSDTFGCAYCGGQYGSNPCGMAACEKNKCVYVSNKRMHQICKVAVGENNLLTFWAVGDRPQELSVTDSHSVLVVFRDANVIREYTTDGGLVRRISLKAAVLATPLRAVELPGGQYAVIHQLPNPGFSIVNSDGQRVYTYGGCDSENLKDPQGVAVDKQGRAFIADKGNSRILVINYKTNSSYPLALPTNCSLDGPSRVHYEPDGNLLYIGECSGGRIVSFKL